MTAVYGLYSNPRNARLAFRALKAAGIKDHQITIMSSEPLDEYEFAGGDRETWMTWIAGLGGLIGLITGYLLTSVTQSLWPINTGGMPIVSNWTNLIVMFELTMLGVVFATVITLLVTARIPSRRPELYDPEISEGKILMGVENPTDPERIEHALRQGADTLKTVP
jgi:hypothetical protein